MAKLNALSKAAIVAAAPVAAYGAFNGFLKTVTELYSKKVWQTPEECAAPMPGDDLVVDPNGYPTYTVSQAKDLNAPLEEVWKHVYQTDITKAGYYSWVNFERIFGMNANNCYNLQEMWQGEECGSATPAVPRKHPVPPLSCYPAWITSSGTGPSR